MMNKLAGKISIADLKSYAKKGKIDTVIVAFTDHIGRFVGKRFDANFYVSEIHENGTHACDYLLTTDMEMEPLDGFSSANWELGYGDFHLVPDPATLRIASWLKKTAVVICDVYDNSSHELIPIAPRSILKSQLQALPSSSDRVMAASELEYYLFNQSYEDAHRSGFNELKTAGWYIEDYHIMQGSRNEKFTAKVRKHLNRSGIPVENSKGEWGVGQHELNIRYSDVLEMADRHVLYKQCMKEIADKKGLSVTFMAKYHEAHAGSSCHIHLSLWSGDDNSFDGENDMGSFRCSDEFKWFLGGWIQSLPELMPFYAPTINSYKRYVDASWAPTRIAWSYDNRTAGFRVVGKGHSLRIECRVPGADCNPYLAFAAGLGGGLHGLRNKIEPPEIFEGDMYQAKDLLAVPNSLADANEKMMSGSLAREILGDSVIDHYGHFFQTEIDAHKKGVTDWERKRYFERI